jgi:hypothetical protein
VSHQGTDDDEKSVRRFINTRTEDMVNGAGLNWLFFFFCVRFQPVLALSASCCRYNGVKRSGSLLQQTSRCPDEAKNVVRKRMSGASGEHRTFFDWRVMRDVKRRSQNQKRCPVFLRTDEGSRRTQ